MTRIERIEGSEPHNFLHGTAGRMKWSVLWYVPDKDRIILHRCGGDLNEAVRIYTVAKTAGKNQVTLRCDNVGFPPPKKYMPHSVYVVTKEKYKTPKGKTKTREKREVRHVVPMDRLNRAGIFWCPYCREMRRFQMQSGFTSMHSKGKWIPDPDSRGGLYCPMCGISHRDFHVRRWNPLADRHYLTGRRGRRSNGSRRSK